MPSTTERNISLTDVRQRLIERIRSLESVAVAFSGGVDSAVVAKAAVEAVGENAVAVTAVSPSLATAERNAAREEAVSIGIRHVEVHTTEFQRPEYQANAGNRCFFCKDTLYSLATSKLKELGVACIINGANVDDLGDHRPGMQAAADHAVVSPLIDVGIDKATVRELARYWKLSVAEKPASPCLASRIAYGVEVTEERVRRVELAEAFLKQITGLRELRVRHEADEVARIELPLSDLAQLMDDRCREEVCSHFRSLGFRRITLDLEGFRSGSLNEALPVVALGVDAEITGGCNLSGASR
ncbi:MAG: ATP-dependent sacrificial sulfur transferase LarE [Planctomycetaceae bacterium]